MIAYFQPLFAPNLVNYLNGVILYVLMKLSDEEQRLKILRPILKEMGFEVNENLKVEISTHRGLFSVDIIRNHVVFQPFECKNCSDYGCRGKLRYLKLSLCVTAMNMGWSNLGLNRSELEVLAKIFAFASDALPTHILNQIQSYCRRGSPPIPLNEEPYLISSYPHFNQGGAKFLLQRLRIQFHEGRLPYSLYCILKERYQKFLD